jgi:hypothetical protein
VHDRYYNVTILIFDFWPLALARCWWTKLVGALFGRMNIHPISSHEDGITAKPINPHIFQFLLTLVSPLPRSTFAEIVLHIHTLHSP